MYEREVPKQRGQKKLFGSVPAEMSPLNSHLYSERRILFVLNLGVKHVFGRMRRIALLMRIIPAHVHDLPLSSRHNAEVNRSFSFVHLGETLVST